MGWRLGDTSSGLRGIAAAPLASGHTLQRQYDCGFYSAVLYVRSTGQSAVNYS